MWVNVVGAKRRFVNVIAPLMISEAETGHGFGGCRGLVERVGCGLRRLSRKRSFVGRQLSLERSPDPLHGWEALEIEAALADAFRDARVGWVEGEH